MPPSERSNKIANAFHRLIETGDKSNIANIEYAELETAIFQYHLDKGIGFYKAMESRLQELSDLKTESTQSKKTQKGLFLGILIGIIVTVIGGLLLHIIIKIYF